MARRAGSTLGVVVLAAGLAGCQGSTVSSLPPTPSVPAATLTDPRLPIESLFPRPDPCELIRPASIRYFQHLDEVFPKRTEHRRSATCDWEMDRAGKGVTLVTLQVVDFRPFAALRRCEETVVRDSAGEYCRDEDRRSADITRANLKFYLYWNDTRMSRAKPGPQRTRQEKQITKALVGQLLDRVSG
jgi:hypothetical protein